MKVKLTMLLLVMFMGCATRSQQDPYYTHLTKKVLLDIKLGMTKKEVISIMAKPGGIRDSEVRGSIVNKYNQVVEVWQYYLYNTPNPECIFGDVYWLYFCNGKLVQWGRAGDWQKEADKIYEMRFR